MKKVLFTLSMLLLIAVAAKTQTVADFQTPENYAISSWTFTTPAAITDDPADANNKVLMVVKDAGLGTWDAGVWVKLAQSVPVTSGNKRFVFKMKASGVNADSLAKYGCRIYVKLWAEGAVKQEFWSESITENDTWVELIKDNIGVPAVDSFTINVGGWDNNNNPPVPGTYYFDDFKFVAPPSIPVVPPRVVVPIKKAVDAIEFDGMDIEDSWYYADIHEVNNGNVNQGYAASFMGTWDDNYLYLFLTVTDPNPFLYDGTDSWKKDGTQLYVDVRNKLLLNSIDNMRQHQITLPYGGAQSDISIWVGIQLAPYYADSTKSLYLKYFSQSTSNGYNLEIRIPWAPMYFNNEDVNTYDACLAAKTIHQGDTLGFEVQMNNYNPATGNREQILTWSSTPNDNPGAYQNSGVWGGLKLVGTSGVDQYASGNKMKVYPNPVSDKMQVELKGLRNVEVYNLVGQKVLSVQATTDMQVVNTKDLAKGMYLVKAIDNKGVSYSQKIMVK
ncbi:MAG: T9SS type A sorting domain-containing protein [Bacteroidales bacterium]|nr:T9SS type A sorting domain-containing protein [Bacteroidales bacterium]